MNLACKKFFIYTIIIFSIIELFLLNTFIENENKISNLNSQIYDLSHNTNVKIKNIDKIQKDIETLKKENASIEAERKLVEKKINKYKR